MSIQVLSRLTQPAGPEVGDDVTRQSDLADVVNQLRDEISQLRAEMLQMSELLPAAMFNWDANGNLERRDDGQGNHLLVSTATGDYALVRVGVIGD